MKILVVGSFVWDVWGVYESAMFTAFQELGYDTYKFGWNKYFGYNNLFSFNWKNILGYKAQFLEMIKRAQQRFRRGPIINRINRDLIEYANSVKPDLIFIYQGVFLTRETIKALKGTGAAVFGYCNDDPFSTIAPKYFWSRYLRSCTEYDHIFSYRLKNLSEYKKFFDIDSELLRSYYLENRNYRLEKPNEKYKCDVLFIGHFENDGRDEKLVKIARKGYNLKLFGTAWQNSKSYSEIRNIMGVDIYPVKEEYNAAMNSCKIALVFLSKVNNDTYTRRCFEIPATGTFMLSEYSDDLATLFEPDKEAAFFSNADEMLAKVDYYLSHDDKRKRVAHNGYERVMRDGHEIKDRAKQIVRAYEKFKIKGESAL